VIGVEFRMGIRDQELVQEIRTSKYLFQKAGSFGSPFFYPYF
jgi:hypothetical protein